MPQAPAPRVARRKQRRKLEGRGQRAEFQSNGELIFRNLDPVSKERKEPDSIVPPQGVCNVIWLVVGSLLPSMLVAWGAAFVVRRVGPRFGLVDRPGHRKVHSHPTPTCGGLAIWLGIVVSFALGQAVLGVMRAGALAGGGMTLPPFVAPASSGSGRAVGPALDCPCRRDSVLVVLGLADDRRGLDWRVRLGVQTLVAATMVVLEPRLRMTLFLHAPWLTGALSVVWIVGLINSFNMLDNMDGLSAGVAAIAAAIPRRGFAVGSPTAHPPTAVVRGRIFIGPRGGPPGLSLAQPTAGAAFHGRRRLLPHRLPAGDRHIDRHVRRRESAAARDFGPLVRARRAALRHDHRDCHPVASRTQPFRRR